MGRAPCCDKANVKKGPWSPEEDNILKSYIEKYGTGGNWIALPQKIGLRRCGKSCRLRWLNYLRPNIKHGGFSEEEENIICSLYLSIGSRWSIIAGQLPGRTDNDIKNYWNTRLKKKLLQQSKQSRQYQTLTPPSNPSSTYRQDLVKWECDNNLSSDHNTMIKFYSDHHEFQQPMTTLPSLLVPQEETISDFQHQSLITNNLEMSSDYYSFGQEFFQDETGCNNLYKWDGIESLLLSGVDNMVCKSMVTSTSASTENTSFEDINSLVYYPSFANYEISQNDHIQRGCNYNEPAGRLGVQQGSFV